MASGRHSQIDVSIEVGYPSPDGNITGTVAKQYKGREADQILKGAAKDLGTASGIDVTAADRDHPGETCKATVAIKQGNTDAKISIDGALCQSVRRQLAPVFTP